MWVDVVTCGLAMLEKGRLSGDWCSLIRVLDKGKGLGGLANECNCPMSEQPFLNRYEGLDILPGPTTNSVQNYAQKEQKRHFALKFDLLLISIYFGILWPKELEGLD